MTASVTASHTRSVSATHSSVPSTSAHFACPASSGLQLNTTVANGFTWYAGARGVYGCTSVCASYGKVPASDYAAITAAQNTVGKCQALRDAFGSTATLDVGSHAYACAGALFACRLLRIMFKLNLFRVGYNCGGSFYCSTDASTCSSQHCCELPLHCKRVITQIVPLGISPTQKEPDSWSSL